MNLDVIYNEDCLQGLRELPDNSVDLLVTDPPYKFDSGGGAFGSKKRDYHAEYIALGNKENANPLDLRKRKATNDTRLICEGFDFSVLNECCRVLKKINAYVWCNKELLIDVISYFSNKGCKIDILTWHKTNPIPTCNNTYLSDTEYCVFAREKGVKLYGSYQTKKKYWVTPCNVADKKLWEHPTIKPLDIIEQLIGNSSLEGQVVLDPFMGSGTTAVASQNLNRHFIGYEIDKRYYDIATNRITSQNAKYEQLRLL